MPSKAVLSPGMSELCYQRALNIVRSNLSSLKSFDNKGESVASRLKHFDIWTRECFSELEQGSTDFFLLLYCPNYITKLCSQSIDKHKYV
jgi:hypothetical protein